MRVFQNQKGNITFYLLGLIVLACFLLVGGLGKQKSTNDGSYKTERAAFGDKTTVADSRSLQLNSPLITVLPTVPLPTPTPKPGTPTPGSATPTPGAGTPTPGATVTPTPIFPGGCPLGICPPTATPTPSGPPPRPVCEQRVEKRDDCDCGELTKFGMTCPGSGKEDCYFGIIDRECDASYTAPDSGCIPACVPKPVIYLYPTEKTIVSVTITTSGTIVKSDPLYPESGWKDIEAYPDGHFIYNGKTYYELFYETGIIPVREPESGISIPMFQLRDQLTVLTRQLGLIPIEQLEFIEFWIPRLEALQKPYIFFSIVDIDEKERVDTVEISPKPDTMIEFIAYFKGIAAPQISTRPLLLPKNPPKRIGFTAVEWGGTIAQ